MMVLWWYCNVTATDDGAGMILQRALSLGSYTKSVNNLKVSNALEHQWWQHSNDDIDVEMDFRYTGYTGEAGE